MRILATIRSELMPPTILLGVDFAVTSAEVSRALYRSRYDVLVMGDMADQAGADFARKLRKEGWALPIILVSNEELSLPDVHRIQAPGSDIEVDLALQKVRERLPDYRGDEQAFGFRELLALTRASTHAQTMTAEQITQMSDQIAGMRRDLAEFQHSMHRDAHELQVHIDGLKLHGEKQREAIVAAVDNSLWRRARDIFGWITEHPLATMGFFAGFLVLLVTLALALRMAGPDNVKLLRDLLPASSPHPPTN